MEIIAKPKKWGNSIGVIIPSEIIKKQGITLNDELIIHIEKKNNAEKKKLMKESYIEMAEESRKINKEFEQADPEWPD